MPHGKGTYGKKVGRPPLKKKKTATGTKSTAKSLGKAAAGGPSAASKAAKAAARFMKKRKKK